MSLINDMLTDLEARRANDLKRTGLQGEVRPLPRLDRTDGRRWWGLAFVVLFVLAALLLYWWGTRPGAPKAPLPVVAAPIVVPAPAPAPEIEAPVLAVPVMAFVGDHGLQTATSLSFVPAERQVSSTTLAVTTSSQVATRTSTTLPARPVTAVVLAPPAVAVEAPLKIASEAAAIDKRAVFSSPRERLEADVRNAVQAAAAGRAAEAAEQLRDILRQDPSLNAARQALLRVLLEQRRIDEMMAVLGEGLDLQVNQIGWAISLARLWVERGDYAAAQPVLARSAPHASANPEYLGFFAHVQYKQSRYREAADLYSTAAKLASNEGRWWLGLGVALEADGRSGEARDAFRKALASGSLNADLSAMAEQKLR